MAITLIVGFPQSSNGRRVAEYDECLRKNLENRSFDKVVLLQEEDGSRKLDAWATNGKIKIERIGRRATYADYLEIANRLSGVVVIANADVYFDWSAQKLNHVSDRTFYIITRTDRLSARRLWSSDAWVFIPPIPLKGCDWELGRIGCENAMVIQVKKQLAWPMLNVCHEVRLVHVHGSNVFSDLHDFKVKRGAIPILATAKYDKNKKRFVRR